MTGIRELGLLQSACIGALVGVVWRAEDGWSLRILAVLIAAAAIGLRLYRDSRIAALRGERS